MKTINSILSMKKILILFMTIGLITSCSDDDDPDPVNEGELITTVVLTLTNDADPTDIITLTYRDLDGDGGDPPIYTPSLGIISENSTYSGSIQLWNETVNPPEDINEEILAEADEHEFFYVAGGFSWSVIKTDVDSNGNPLGLETTMIFSAGGGNTGGGLGVFLRHEPIKPNDNSLANAGGSTDLFITYPVIIANN